MEALRTRVDASRQFAEQGNLGRAMMTGLTDPNIPQRQTNLIVESRERAAAAADAGGQAPRVAREERLGAAGRDDRVRRARDDFDSWDRCITRGMPSSMMPYRYNGGFSIRQAPGYVIFDLEMIHESRVIPTDGRPPLRVRGQAVARRVARPLGRQHARRRDDELPGRPAADQLGRRRLAAGQSLPAQRPDEDDGARRASQRRHVALRDHDRRSGHSHGAVHGPLSDEPRRELLWPEYACHEDNTIVRNYTNTSRHERANPTPEPPQPPVQVGPGVADALAGRWVGRPRIATIDVDIELEFTKNADGTVNGKLIGTNLGRIDRTLRSFTIADRHRVLHAAERRPVAVLRRYGRRHDHGRRRERAGRRAGDVPQADRRQPLADRRCGDSRCGSSRCSMQRGSTCPAETPGRNLRHWARPECEAPGAIEIGETRAGCVGAGTRVP